MRGFGTSLAAVALAAMLATSAGAHGIWFAQRATQLALIYGVGADDLDSVKRQPLVESVTAYDASYKPIPAQLRVAGPLLLVDTDEQPTLVAAVLQNGVWSRMAGGEYEKKGRDEMPGAAISERTVKYAVTIQGPLEQPIPALTGQRLQIVPVGAIPDKLDAPLTYKVLLDGKPVAGARLIADMVNDPDAAEIKTDAEGVATLPVRNQGLNVIRAVFDGPTDDPKRYDKIEHTATLAFTLAHAPE